MAKCSQCGTENQDNTSFCQNCGKQINYQIKDAGFNKQTESFESIKWSLVVPAALFIGIIGYLGPDSGPYSSLWIFFIIIFLVFIAVGYIVKDPIAGALNGAVTGVIAFSGVMLLIGEIFLSEGYLESFAMLILSMITGAILGVIGGGIGGYIKKNKP